MSMTKLPLVIGFILIAVVTTMLGACEIKVHHYN